MKPPFNGQHALETNFWKEDPLLFLKKTTYCSPERNLYYLFRINKPKDRIYVLKASIYDLKDRINKLIYSRFWLIDSGNRLKVSNYELKVSNYELKHRWNELIYSDFWLRSTGNKLKVARYEPKVSNYELKDRANEPIGSTSELPYTTLLLPISVFQHTFALSLQPVKWFLNTFPQHYSSTIKFLQKMSRPTVKVEIPIGKPDDFLTLAAAIAAKHTELGEGSPVKSLNMSTFGANVTKAKGFRDDAAKLHKQAETLNEQSRVVLGISENQNSQIEGTVYNLITRVRDILLGIYRGQEEKLNEWGFNIVGGTSVPGRKAAKAAKDSK
jgi:hypothetical protein